MSNLIWNPINSRLQLEAKRGGGIDSCISAYITSAGMREVVRLANLEKVYVIARWRIQDLALGASDIDIFPLLEEEGVPLYINLNLHSKIISFSDGSAICGSGNVTSKGLGLIENQNIETAVFIDLLNQEDEFHLRKLRDSSIRVTPEVYVDFKKAVSEIDVLNLSDLSSKIFGESDQLIYANHQRGQKYLISQLPITKTPQKFLEGVRRGCFEGNAKLLQSDCYSFGIRADSESDDLESVLRDNFCNSAFVKAVVSEIRQNESMNFGAVARFIHDHCRDVPMPYRAEVKERVNTLYNWLCYFFEDLSWDVPGSYSQVIRTDRIT